MYYFKYFWKTFCIYENRKIISKEMKIIKKFLWDLVGYLIMFNFIIVNCVLCNFLSIKGSCWSLNWTTESIIIVALMISHFNYLFFFQACGVNHNLVVDWSSWCCSGILVCYHIEIEILVTIIINDIRLNNCSFDWILFRFVSDLEESGDVVFVNKYVQQLGIIVLIKFLECFIQFFFWFKFQAFVFIGWSTNCISINYYLTWTLVLIDFSPIFKCFNYKWKHNIFPFLTNDIV